MSLVKCRDSRAPFAADMRLIDARDHYFGVVTCTRGIYIEVKHCARALIVIIEGASVCSKILITYKKCTCQQ